MKCGHPLVTIGVYQAARLASEYADPNSRFHEDHFVFHQTYGIRAAKRDEAIRKALIYASDDGIGGILRVRSKILDDLWVIEIHWTTQQVLEPPDIQ